MAAKKTKKNVKKQNPSRAQAPKKAAKKGKKIRLPGLEHSLSLEARLAFALDFANYMNELASHGVLEGATGHQVIQPDVLTLLEAAHQVLAGGTLSVAPQVTGADAGTAAALDQSLAKVITDINGIDSDARYWPLFG